MDLTATILTIAGAAGSAKLDGIDLMPIVSRQAAETPRRLFWRVSFTGLSQRATRDGNWKLLMDGVERMMLFDVSKDLGEREDVAATNTAVVRRLMLQYRSWAAEVDADAKARASARGANQAMAERK
jgi:arylsulfatase A-like enzyme